MRSNEFVQIVFGVPDTAKAKQPMANQAKAPGSA